MFHQALCSSQSLKCKYSLTSCNYLSIYSDLVSSSCFLIHTLNSILIPLLASPCYEVAPPYTLPHQNIPSLLSVYLLGCSPKTDLKVAACLHIPWAG